MLAAPSKHQMEKVELQDCTERPFDASRVVPLSEALTTVYAVLPAATSANEDGTAEVLLHRPIKVVGKNSDFLHPHPEPNSLPIQQPHLKSQS